MLLKKVNIYPSMPITALNPVIRTATKNIYKSVDEIKICINSRAIVEEILNNGSIIKLNLSNYDKDNNSYENVVVDVDKTIADDAKKSENVHKEVKQMKESDKIVETPEKAETANPSGDKAHELFDGLSYDEVDAPTDEKVDFTPDDEKGL